MRSRISPRDQRATLFVGLQGDRLVQQLAGPGEVAIGGHERQTNEVRCVHRRRRLTTAQELFRFAILPGEQEHVGIQQSPGVQMMLAVAPRVPHLPKLVRHIGLKESTRKQYRGIFIFENFLRKPIKQEFEPWEILQPGQRLELNNGPSRVF